MRLTIVRHARAGSKRAWEGDDALRPLDELGLRAGRRRSHRDWPPPCPVRRLVEQPGAAVRADAAAAGRRRRSPDRAVGRARPARRRGWRALDARAPGVRRRGPVHARRGAAPAAADAAPARGSAATAPTCDGRRLLAKGSAWLVTIAPDGTVSSFEHLAPALISTVGLTAMTSTRAERAYAAVQQELDNERAAVLGRTGRRLEEALADVRRARSACSTRRPTTPRAPRCSPSTGRRGPAARSGGGGCTCSARRSGSPTTARSTGSTRQPSAR